MSTKPWFVWIACTLVLLAGCAGTGSGPPSGRQPPPDDAVQITVLYDAFGRDTAMRKDWGYAALVEAGGRRILFDTGNDGEVLAANAKSKGVDLSRLDFVVMSHRHGDHMGGLAHVLSVNPQVTIYAPKEGFGVYGGDLPGTFFRSDETLPPEQRYFDGKPPEILRFGAAWPKARFRLVDKTTQIAPGVHLIAQVSDKPGTLELRELSLAIETPEGLVIVVGCSHPGIDNIVKAATAIDTRILLVAGGFHLVVAKDAEIESIVAALAHTQRVRFVAPGHCTGEPTFNALFRAFGDRYVYAGVGSVLTAGGSARALAGGGVRGAALDTRDVASYRRLQPRDDDDAAHAPRRPDGERLTLAR